VTTQPLTMTPACGPAAATPVRRAVCHRRGARRTAVVRDIRTLYAALGLLLVALRNITPRTAVITAGCALLALAAVQLLATSGGDDAGLSFLDVQALAFAAVIWLVRDRLRWSCSCSAWRRETPPAGGRASPGPVAPAHPVDGFLVGIPIAVWSALAAEGSLPPGYVGALTPFTNGTAASAPPPSSASRRPASARTATASRLQPSCRLPLSPCCTASVVPNTAKIVRTSITGPRPATDGAAAPAIARRRPLPIWPVLTCSCPHGRSQRASLSSIRCGSGLTPAR
jgi:hypothetical protein